MAVRLQDLTDIELITLYKEKKSVYYQAYMGEKRKTLVDKFGFDVKNASHLIRLLRMGIEFLNDGVMYVQRHDTQQLLEIKRGEWSLTQVQEEAKRLFALSEEAYVRSKLPVGPDSEVIKTHVTTVLWNHFRPEFL